ncbi:hypothetical protein JK363_36265 [Streptomyces sp. 205]|uniref:Uncharacterized protein n=1 Tax=Streptomyces coffeae TaxID=621382 RepID=A0ABS1NQG2_9ACTN|nr:hypothetical protein [Streptomyces coffeae]
MCVERESLGFTSALRRGRPRCKAGPTGTNDAVPDTAWQPIRYPRAVVDPDSGELISDAEVAEIPDYTGFTGRKNAEHVTARLIVRRVRDLVQPATIGEQDELLPVWRYHPFFTVPRQASFPISGNTDLASQDVFNILSLLIPFILLPFHELTVQ